MQEDREAKGGVERYEVVIPLRGLFPFGYRLQIEEGNGKLHIIVTPSQAQVQVNQVLYEALNRHSGR